MELILIIKNRIPALFPSRDFLIFSTLRIFAGDLLKDEKRLFN